MSLGGYSLPEIMKFLWNNFFSTRPSSIKNAAILKYGTLGLDSIVVNISPEGNARVYFEVIEALISKTPNWWALLSCILLYGAWSMRISEARLGNGGFK